MTEPEQTEAVEAEATEAVAEDGAMGTSGEHADADEAAAETTD